MVLENGIKVDQLRGEILVSPEAFLQQTQWLKHIYASVYGAESQPYRRICAGLDVAGGFVAEANQVDVLLHGEELVGIREMANSHRGVGVMSGKAWCMDGRLTQHLQDLPRGISFVRTPAGLLRGKPTIWGDKTLKSSQLNAAIRENVARGFTQLEGVGPHVSLDHPTNHGCGASAKTLLEQHRHTSEFVDGGFFADLTREERQNTKRWLAEAGALVYDYVVDTDTQGGIYFGDALAEDLLMTRDAGKYEPLTKEVIKTLHNKGDLVYTPALLEEDDFARVLHESGYDHHSLFWDSADNLLTNYQQIMGLVDHILKLPFEKQLMQRFTVLYGQRIPHEGLRQLVYECAYNVASIWLSGFDQSENVPAKFTEHRERGVVVGAKGFEYNSEYPFFSVDTTEGVQDLSDYLKTTFDLAPDIIRNQYRVDLQEEAIVVFVTMPVDVDSDTETQRRALADLEKKYHDVAMILGERVRDGYVVLVPALVAQKTRGVVRIPDFSYLYQN